MDCLVKAKLLAEATEVLQKQIEVDLANKLEHDFFDSTAPKPSSLLAPHTFTIVIRALARQSKVGFRNALALLKSMYDVEIQPDKRTVTSLLTS